MWCVCCGYGQRSVVVETVCGVSVVGMGQCSFIAAFVRIFIFLEWYKQFCLVMLIV